MEKQEKVEFILEQMRLCLAKKDFVRTQIISKKISTKYFEEKDTHVSGITYLQYRIDTAWWSGDGLNVCVRMMCVRTVRFKTIPAKMMY